MHLFNYLMFLESEAIKYRSNNIYLVVQKYFGPGRGENENNIYFSIKMFLYHFHFLDIYTFDINYQRIIIYVTLNLIIGP